MGKSYRIRTTPGDDKNIILQLDQDFEQLEILSLKIRQQDVYNRDCAEYGIIVGRVTANKGYGIPNAKVSVFIPLTAEDEENPVISTLYPYKNLEQTNEDGYKYNLLPYVPSHGGHTPTGTFPTRLDAINNQTVVELYDKYYKFTTTSNDSGDYMIFGVPVGSQTIVMNVDLSDIGPFSLNPQDLIRMGVGVDGQFAGARFKSSPNFNELPQIIVINKTVDVIPFYGQPEICQAANAGGGGISRSDFDLSTEANIDIQPTAIFMGSLMSNTENTGVKANGVPKITTGNLCSMIAGPGEILAITQTIFKDSAGLPVLQQAELPQGGKLIDGSGAWMFDLAMNARYISTDEFGNQIISDDPSVGIPTRAKYRFKIKWQQSKNINEDYKRGYFLVPNIREKGWDENNPDFDPLSGGDPTAFLKAQSSYAFSLSWSSYTWDINNVTITNPDILDAINCEDTFYEFEYNKVYTVSGLIDLEKTRRFRSRFIGIKRINDDVCEGTVNKYPTNDALLFTPLSWIINNILVAILIVIIIPFVILYSIVAFIVNLIFMFILWALCRIQEACFLKICPFSWLGINCDQDPPMGPLSFPMMSYPDCDICDCNDDAGTEDGTVPPKPAKIPSTRNSTGLRNTVSGFDSRNPETLNTNFPTINDGNVSTFFPGTSGSLDAANVNKILYGQSFGSPSLLTNDITVPERINSFNQKANFYEDRGGNNQIELEYMPTSGNSKTYDNVFVFLFGTGQAPIYSTLSLFLSGGTTATTTFSFSEFIKVSEDPNIEDKNNTRTTEPKFNKWGTKSTVGETTYPTSVNIEHADPNNRTLNITRNIQVGWPGNEPKLYGQPADVEVFQTITAMSLSQFVTNSKQFPRRGSLAEIFKGKIYMFKSDGSGGYNFTYSELSDITNFNSIGVVIAQRGVDLYTDPIPTKVGLGRLFGFDNHSQIEITRGLRLNIPIRSASPGSEIMVDHSQITANDSQSNGLYLFHPSYVFVPDTSGEMSYLQWTSKKLISNYSSLNVGQNIVNNIDLNTVATQSPPPYQGVNDLRVRDTNPLFFNPNQGPNYDLYDGQVYFFNNTAGSVLGIFDMSPIRFKNNPGTQAISLTPRRVSGSLVSGDRYKIIKIDGDINDASFTGAGAPDDNLGTIFTANANAPSWGNDTSGVAGILGKLDLLAQFVTPNGLPGINIVPQGYWSFYYRFESSPSRTAKFILRFELYHTDGVNTTLIPFDPSTNGEKVINTTDDTGVIRVLIPSNFTIPPTDRLLIQVYGISNETPSQTARFVLQPNDPNTLGSFVITSYPRDDAKYTLNESIHGGTYEYKDGFNLRRANSSYAPINVNMKDHQRIIMRSDRLPAMDKGGIGQHGSWGSVFVLPVSNRDAASNKPPGSPSFNRGVDGEFSGQTPSFESSVLNSFSCNGMRDLSCYESKNNSGIPGAQVLSVDPNCKTRLVRNGCYWVVTEPLLGLFDPIDGDIAQMFEYSYRFRFYMALCQGVLAPTFYNNWVNGNLFAVAFKVNTIYNRNNKVKRRRFPRRIVVLQIDDNNFYYRSSPYDDLNSKFIGGPPITQKQTENGANKRNLKYPTTILNMGPREAFLKELILNDRYYGYFMDKLSPSSYNDIEDIISFFVASRMSDPNFLNFIGGNTSSIFSIFSRAGKGWRVDGDFAQSIAVNSQVGVVPFDAGFYRTDQPIPDAIILGNVGKNSIFGIFFDSSNEDLELRDLISPIQLTRYSPTGLNSGIFEYDQLPKLTQLTPHYRWGLDQAAQNAFNLFGSQFNDWATTTQDIYVSGYQDLNRRTSDYPKGNVISDWDYRGYLYNLQNNGAPLTLDQGTLQVGTIYTIIDYNAGDDFTGVGGQNGNGVTFNATGTSPVWNNKSLLVRQPLYSIGQAQPNSFIGGAPWYFYFGLIRGETALNKFIDKYIKGLLTDE